MDQGDLEMKTRVTLFTMVLLILLALTVSAVTVVATTSGDDAIAKGKFIPSPVGKGKYVPSPWGLTPEEPTSVIAKGRLIP